METINDSMDHEPPVFESYYKKLGLVLVDRALMEEMDTDKYKPYIKVLYVPSGYSVVVDFKEYVTESPSLFFINSNQYFRIQGVGGKKGYLIYYNRDFYCVQIHDAEVACDGLLFNNLSNMPMTRLKADDMVRVDNIFGALREELNEEQGQQEEMLRIYLKQLIIFATRLWKVQELGERERSLENDTNFFRQFSLLVETHYKEKHAVSDYAEILGLAPKTLTHKLRRMNLSHPNEVIKDRIILEAKRLLIHTSMSAKQIAYHLGYEDPGYFNRLFTSKVGENTSDFRKKYNQGKMSN